MAKEVSLTKELRRIAKAVRAEFDPSSIGKKENSGPEVQDNIKNHALFDWMDEWEAVANKGPNKNDNSLDVDSFASVESQAASTYSGGVKNMMFNANNKRASEETNSLSAHPQCREAHTAALEGIQTFRKFVSSVMSREDFASFRASFKSIEAELENVMAELDEFETTDEE